MSTPVVRKRWRKSSYSGNPNNNCVEICDTLDAVRDSKNPNGPELTIPRSSLVAFLGTIQSEL